MFVFLLDGTAKMYKLLRLCQKHYDKMLGFSQSVPQHFWKYLAPRCLKFMDWRVAEASSFNHEEQIAACFKDCTLNVSGEWRANTDSPLQLRSCHKSNPEVLHYWNVS